MSFQTEIRIHFDEGDPAGVAFSGGLFRKMHQCFEEFVMAMGIDSQQYFFNEDWAFPIRLTECQFLKPLAPLQNYKVSIGVSQISHSSFTVQYEVISKDQVVCSQIKSVHVCLEKKTLKKAAIPDFLKNGLENFAI